MPADQNRNEPEEDPEDQRQTTFLHESDFPSEDSADPSLETRHKRSGGRDTLGVESNSMIGETVTLSVDDSTVLGNFRLVSKLGSGGFGTVYKAEDLRLDRFVAIKAALARPADRGDEQFKRVFHEGRAAAALDHPNIVSIYDVALLDGKPYIVCQLIDGVTLQEWKSSESIDPKQLAKLLIQVARAVDYAHSKGVVHRDLKPGNILMDTDGVPYVNDFGIAKHSDADETISQESSIIGTPAYMSPEQASGHSREADGRSDLYSIGVILYELVTGEKPFRGHSKMLIHHVIHTDPQPPRSLNQSVPRDLETICLKCLEKEPDRRYQTCAELADELQRFVDGEPIKARPISSAEHFVRRCRRHPTTTAITGGLLAAIAIGLIGVTWQWRRAETSRQQEVAARLEVERSRKELADKVAFSNQMLHDAESKLAFSSMSVGDHRHANEALVRLAGLGDLEYHLIRNVQRRYTEWYRHVELIRDIAVSDDEKYVAAAGLRTLLVWDTDTGQVIFRFRRKGQQLQCVGFEPGGHWLAWGGQSGVMHLKSVDRPGDKTVALKHGAPITTIKFSADGDQILSAADDGTVKTWSLRNQANTSSHQVSSAAINAADFAGDGKLIAGTAKGTLLLCDIETGECDDLFQSRASILAIDVHEDGKQFVVGARDGRLTFGRTDEPDQTNIVQTSHGPVLDAEFWGSGDAVITTNLFGRLSVWRLGDLSIRESHRYFQGAGRFAIARASDRVIIGGGDGGIVAFDLAKIRPDVIEMSQGGIRDLMFSGATLVVCHESGPASVLEHKSGRLVQTIPGNDDSGDNPKTMSCVDGPDGGSKLAFGTNDGRILVWDSQNGKTRLHGSPSEKSISSIRLLRDASLAISGGIDGSVRLWDLSKADESVNLTALGGVVRGLALSRDQRHAVAVSANGMAVLIDVRARRIIRRENLNQPLHSVAWSRDGSQIAIGGDRGTLHLYGRGLVQQTSQIEAHNGSVKGVLFSPSGKRVITIGNDDHVAFSNLVTNRSGAVLEGTHSSNIRSLAIDTDGRLLATGDAGGQIRIWSMSIQNR